MKMRFGFFVLVSLLTVVLLVGASFLYFDGASISGNALFSWKYLKLEQPVTPIIPIPKAVTPICEFENIFITFKLPYNFNIGDTQHSLRVLKSTVKDSVRLNIDSKTYTIKINETLKVSNTIQISLLKIYPDNSIQVYLYKNCAPLKYLTLITVTRAGEEDYSDIGWGTYLEDLGIRENNNVQIFDVVIWQKSNIQGRPGNPNNPNRISVYKFDRTFNASNPAYINGGQAWVNYRESFNILNVDVPPSCSSAQGWTSMYECSHAYLAAFKTIIKTIVTNQPAEHYGIKYLGHGTTGGFFENTLSGNDSQLLLAYTNSVIGKKLDFLDWSSNCNVGTYRNVKIEYKYANYILASDLIRNTFYTGDNSYLYKLKPDFILATFFFPSKTIKQSLIDMLNSERALWETPPTKNAMISRQEKQSVSIYDTGKFENLMNSAHLEEMPVPPGGDILEYIRTNYPTQEQKFYDFRFYYISNKNFFSWDVDSNGFKKEFLGYGVPEF